MVLKEILGLKEKLSISSQHMPKHVGISMNGSFSYAFKKKIDPVQIAQKDFSIVKEIIEAGTDLNIPVLSFFVVSERVKNSKNFLIRMDSIARFFRELTSWDLIHNRKVKVTVLGKWYDLPSKVIEETKAAISETKDYDGHFVNFCINYDGQEEIVDACKMIGRQVQAGKLDPEAINKDMIKENIYSSYFLPPDLIIKTGLVHTLYGFLLWDSANSKVHFADKKWPEFSKTDLLKGIAAYQSRL